MIDDPIRLESRLDESLYDLCRGHPGEQLFIINHSGNALFYLAADAISKERLHHPKLWKINTFSDWRYRIREVPMRREGFIERMMQYYPDHFEWLLFHPEFLP